LFPIYWTNGAEQAGQLILTLSVNCFAQADLAENLLSLAIGPNSSGDEPVRVGMHETIPGGPNVIKSLQGGLKSRHACDGETAVL